MAFGCKQLNASSAQTSDEAVKQSVIASLNAPRTTPVAQNTECCTTTVSIRRAPPEDAHMTCKASISCLCGGIPAPSGRSKKRVVRRTTALLAFALSPSRASQFLRTASETEPARPMQKYSSRRCADSTGAASAVGKRLHPPWNSPDGLKASVHRYKFRRGGTRKYRGGAGVGRSWRGGHSRHYTCFISTLAVRDGSWGKGGIYCPAKATRFSSSGETSTTKGKQGSFLDLGPRKRSADGLLYVETLEIVAARQLPARSGGATLGLFVAAPVGYL